MNKKARGCEAMAEFFSQIWDAISGFFKQLLMAFADMRIFADLLDIIIVAFVI